MPTMKRHKTKYPGVVYVEGTDPRTGKPEKIFYIRYRRDGKQVEEKAGRQHINDMTAAKASKIRASRMAGEPTNIERREAEREAAETEAGRWTLARLWAEYKRQKPDLKGLAQDESRWRRFIKTDLGNKEPAELIALDLDRLRVRLLKDHSPQHVKHVLALVRRLISWGASKGLCAPLSFRITMPKVDNEVTEDLTPKQLEKLLVAIEADPHPHAGPMMKLALYTGMRKGELLRLKWADVDFQRGFIRLVKPKGGKTTAIPMNDQAKALLESHPREQGSEFVFPGRGGQQRREIRRPIERIRKAAGLPDGFRPLHGLRHTFASMLASSGDVDLFTLQRLMNHRHPSTTQRYSHLRDEALRRASDLAGDLVAKAVEDQAEENKVLAINGDKNITDE